MLNRVDIINLQMLVQNEIFWLEENNVDGFYEEELEGHKDLLEKLQKMLEEKGC